MIDFVSGKYLNYTGPALVTKEKIYYVQIYFFMNKAQ